MNLAFVCQLCDSGNLVTFSSSCCYVQDLQSWKLIVIGHRKGELYILDELKEPVTIVGASIDFSSFCLSLFSSFYLWHSRLGYVSSSHLKFLAPTGALGKFQTHDKSDCSGCKLAKFSALPFNQSVSISSSPFDMIHSNVWGPSPVPIKGGSRYYVSFIVGFFFYFYETSF